MSENQQNMSNIGQKQVASEYYYFDGFAFDVEADELIVAQTQQRHKLEPQVSQLLTLLVQNQDQVLSKELLQQTLWPNTIVEQNSLYQVLAKLRKLLNDSSRSPKYIKTIPKKGYCFIAEVSTSLRDNESKQEALAVTPASSDLPKTNPIRYGFVYLVVFLLAVIFTALWFNSTEKKSTTVSYQLEDVSYQLGLEFDVSVHKSHDLMAYVKDINNLYVTTKQGDVIYQKDSQFRIAFPAWHPERKLLAYWQYREQYCELFVITPQGAKSYQAPAIECDSAVKPVWLNSEELALTLTQAGDSKIYRYRLAEDVISPMEIPLSSGELAVGVIKAWGEQYYYFVKDNEQLTRLLDQQGNTVLTWDFPVWLFAFDSKTQRLISNDHSLGKTLIATSLDGSTVEVVSSVEGIFTSLSIDNLGDIYTAIEHWQVNIRDEQGKALLSTSSIDYLANTNALGEIAFTSRRTGLYEVYLQTGNKLTKVSSHNSNTFIKFLEWRPDHSMLLSARGNKLSVYDKQGEILQFETSFNRTIKNIGWINNSEFFGFDGEQVQTYNLLGQLTSEANISGQALYYNHQQQTWLLFADNNINQLTSLAAEAKILSSLTDKQAAALQNVRLKQGQLYWQSSWSRQDKIWRLNLLQPSDVELLKEGQLIWHFDVTEQGELLISKMEAIEGDIKRLVINGENKS